MRFKARAGALCCAAWMSVAAVQSAEQSAGGELQSLLSSDLIVTVGAELRFEPSFEGARGNILWPYPLLDVRAAGTPEHFRAPRDGWGIGILELGNLEIGPVGQIRRSRNEQDNGALHGLGDVGWAGEVGAFADYWWMPWLRTHLEVRQGFGGHDGLISELTADAVVPVTGQLTVSGGPRVTLATSGATDPYFGITPSQSAASGLPIFTTSGGLYSLGVGAQARYRWTPNVATHGFIEFERLTGDVAHSPLVVQRGSPDQVTLGFGVSRSFDLKRLW